jgi:hypothetical protein
MFAPLNIQGVGIEKREDRNVGLRAKYPLCIFFIVAPCILKSITVHSPTHALFIKFSFLEKFKIYIRIHMNIAPTCFGLRPSSGS